METWEQKLKEFLGPLWDDADTLKEIFEAVNDQLIELTEDDEDEYDEYED